MNEKIKFSIIMPVYNTSKYISKAIDSVIGQKYENFELIIIDDGSTDNSLNICYQYAKNDERIKVFHKSNSGVSDTRNFGLKKSIGEYICFLDSDDFYSDDYLLTFFNMINENNNDNYLYCCKIEKINSQEKSFNKKNNLQDNRNNIKNKYDLIFTEYGGYLWNKVFKKSIIEENNIKMISDIKMCEDMIFVLNYIEYIDDVILSDKYLYKYRILDNSVSKSLKNKNWFSIFKAFELIDINDIKYSEFFKNQVAFFRLYYLCYAKYRLLFIKDKQFVKQWNKKIKEKLKVYINEKYLLNMFQKIKLISYYYFGEIFFKLKR